MIPNFRKRLDGKRLFLSGGTGFFGKWLLATLRNSGAEVEVTVLSRSGFWRETSGTSPFPPAGSTW